MDPYKSILIRGGQLGHEERALVYGASQIFLCGQEGRSARSFLIGERRLGVKAISDFRLGYMPFSTDHPFQGRIVMPIFDAYSNLIALSVRPATNDKAILGEYGKYWNESYDKGQHLYGLNLAKESIIKNKFAICVEGQMDVLAMHSFGIDNTVGVLGGAFTFMHALLLKKWTNVVVWLFDSDAAGRKHTEHANEILETYGWGPMGSGFKKGATLHRLESVSASMPDGNDPNDYLKKHGATSMRNLVADSLVRVRERTFSLPKYWAA